MFFLNGYVFLLWEKKTYDIMKSRGMMLDENKTIDRFWQSTLLFWKTTL